MYQWMLKFFTVIGGVFAMMATAFAGDSPYNMPYGVTPMSHDIYRLHMITFYICCIIGVVVFSVLFYSIYHYRRSKGAKAANFHEHPAVEVAWTLIPFLILVGLAIPATIVLKDIHNTNESDLIIKITGYQWKWKYEYLDQGISFFSSLSTPQTQIDDPKVAKDEWFLLEVDNPLVIPVHKKVKILVTSNDVIHDWWVPAFGVKQDAIPGYINENWIEADKPGTYRGQCGELCGTYHGFMPIVVQAVPEDQFEQWVAAHSPNPSVKAKAGQVTASAKPVAAEPLSQDDLYSMGQKQYETTCALCHQANGEGMPPTFPALKGSPIATGDVTKNIQTVLNGIPGSAMQAFGKQLNDEQIASVLTYVRNAWGNDKLNEQNKQATVVQPADVAKER